MRPDERRRGQDPAASRTAARSSCAYEHGKVAHPRARSCVRLDGFDEVVDDQSGDAKPMPASKRVDDDRRPRPLQRHPPAGDAVLQLRPRQEGHRRRHRRLPPAARPRRDAAPARRHQGRSASRRRRAPACRSARTTCACRRRKDEILDETAEGGRRDREALRAQGVITEGERYNKIIDLLDARPRDASATEMMERAARATCATASRTSTRSTCMADSGARGSIEQIRQLAGMRGLMAKPSGEIIETPIKANFREGLHVLEYFSLDARRPQGSGRHGAQDGRLGLPDAQAGRRGAERRHHEDDCGTLNGITKARRSTRARRSRSRWRRPIRGRVGARHDRRRRHRRGDRPRERAHHRGDRRSASRLGYEKVRVRSPAHLRGRAGRLRALLRHGPVARHAGRAGPGGRHHRRPVDRRAGHAAHDAHVPHRRHGQPRASRRREITRERAGQASSSASLDGRRRTRRASASSLNRNGEILLARRQGPRARALRRSRSAPCCASSDGDDGQGEGGRSASGTRTTCRSSPSATGMVRFEDIVEGKTVREEMRRRHRRRAAA